MSALRKNIASLMTLQGANYLLPLVTIPYLVRVLGPANYGRIAFAQAFIQYFVMLTDYGFNLSATRDIAHAQGDADTINRIFNAVLAVKFLTALAGFAVMSAIALAVPSMRGDYALFAVSYLAVSGNLLFPVWLYQGVQRMGYITAFTVSARAVMVVAIFALVHREDQFLLAAGLLAAGMPIGGIVALWNARRVAHVHFARPRWADMKRAVVDGWYVFTASFGGTLYNSSNTFMLGLVAPLAVVGYFAAADKLVKAIQSLVYPISQAAYPHIAVLLKRSREEAFRFVGKLLGLFVGGTAIVGIVLAVGAALIAHVAFGPKFAPSAEFIRLLAPWPLLIALNVVFGALFIVQLNLGRLLSASILIPAALHVALLYPVARLWGAPGVAVLMLLTELFVLSIRLVGLRSGHRAELGLLWQGLRGAHA
jgi:PST family polysaccharide transporter